MIKLIVVFMLASTASDGGVAITVHESQFGSMQTCMQAKAWFEGQANQMSGVSYDGRRPFTKALFINATCIDQR
jgi:hypothetical protein